MRIVKCQQNTAEWLQVFVVGESPPQENLGDVMQVLTRSFRQERQSRRIRCQAHQVLLGTRCGTHDWTGSGALCQPCDGLGHGKREVCPSKSL